jgi:hypothetical protein
MAHPLRKRRRVVEWINGVHVESDCGIDTVDAVARAVMSDIGACSNLVPRALIGLDHVDVQVVMDVHFPGCVFGPPEEAEEGAPTVGELRFLPSRSQLPNRVNQRRVPIRVDSLAIQAAWRKGVAACVSHALLPTVGEPGLVDLIADYVGSNWFVPLPGEL